jgi:hypothetical protein
MDDQDYSISHFEQMVRLAIALKALPAQVLDHSYSYESFGSWTTTLRLGGHPLRLLFDGKEREYRLEESTARRAPYSWNMVWRAAASEVDHQCIIEAVRKAGAKAG